MADQFSTTPKLSAGAGRDALWQLRDGVGLEHFRLLMTDIGPLLTGVVITSDAGDPVTVTYAIQCDPNWHTREVSVSVDRSRQDRLAGIHLIADGDGAWWSLRDEARTPLPDLNGCFDIDIAITPSTNTLPIRRLDLAPGAKAPVTAAWIQFPSLEVTTLRQQYTRLGSDRYRYESYRHNFVAMLEVDNLGLLRDYEGLWRRIAESDFSAVDE